MPALPVQCHQKSVVGLRNTRLLLTATTQPLQVLLEQCRSLGLAVARYRSALPSARLLSSAGSASDFAKAAGGGVGGSKGMQKAGKMLGSFASKFGSMVNGGSAGPGPLGATGRRSGIEAAAAASDSPSAAPIADTF
jgi:hypothetical protein